LAIATWAIAYAHAALLVALQYDRPGPLGSPYVLEPKHYFTYAISYEAFGLALLSAPFLLLGAMRCSDRTWAVGSRLQIGLLGLSLLLSQLNHELQRFMGAQLTWDVLRTYANVRATPDVIWSALREDRGGRYSALWGYCTVLPFIALAYVLNRRRPNLPAAAQWVMLAVFAYLAIFQPLEWLIRPYSYNRKWKLEPPIALLWTSLRESKFDESRYHDIASVVARVQRDWKDADGSRQFVFDDARFPLRHRRLTPWPEAPKPNIILLSLETFRARDMGAFNPEVRRSPTPFLDRIARKSTSAYYTRYISNGIPTIYAFISMQTATLPHSGHTVASVFPSTHVDALSQVARDRGYKTMFFTASDPDWDNERFWLSRWYGEIRYRPEYNTGDREMFEDAAQRIIKIAKQDRPFLVTIASISNHFPFRTPDHAFDMGKGKTPHDLLRNTMHYTDDVVKNFVETLQKEPFWNNTVLIVTGDHAYDMGERGVPLGHDNLRHESTWVPLIISGRDPRLPRGAQSRVASHVDLAPTVAQLTGHRGPYAFAGHSLLEPATGNELAIAVRNGNLGVEAATLSVYVPKDGSPLAYDASDRLQRTALSSGTRPELSQVLSRARDWSLFMDWAFEHDRFAPP
jgi:arylsulfatase A-like enzyme